MEDKYREEFDQARRMANYSDTQEWKTVVRWIYTSECDALDKLHEIALASTVNRDSLIIAALDYSRARFLRERLAEGVGASRELMEQIIQALKENQ